MYKAYFQLESNPFSPTPPPNFIFQSKELKEALAHFSFALENREAFLLLTGEVGTGKTTAVQSVLRLLPDNTPVALVTHTTLDPRELLEEVAIRFGLTGVEGKSKPVLLRELETHFEQQWAQGLQSLLILDEAHLLKPSVLEEVRLLSNLEREGGKLVQICLVGQPELVAHLQQDELRQLRQRISVRYALKPLSHGEIKSYIEHRLRAAGAPEPHLIFTEGALQEIHRSTHGIPREINVIAGQGLLNAFLADCPQVLPEHVRSVREDYGFEGLRGTTPSEPGSPGKPAPPPVTRLLTPEDITEVEGEPPAKLPRGVTPRPIPLPPEHLRPEPRAKAPEYSAPPSRETQVEPAPQGPPPGSAPKGKPVPLGSKIEQKSERRQSGPTWLPWVLLVLVGLFFAWRYWLSPMLNSEVDNTPNNAVTQDRDASPAGGEDGNQLLASDALERPQDSTPPAGDPVDEPGASSLSTAVVDSVTDDPADRTPLVQTSQDTAAAPLREAETDGETEEQPLATPVLLDRFLVAPEIRDGRYSGPITGQIMSTQNKTIADSVAARMASRTGLESHVLSSPVGDTQWYRILVGQFDAEQEAILALTPLLQDGTVTEIMIVPAPEAVLNRN